MFYNWKYCSFYPNNFGASALWASVDGKMYICGRKDVHLGTAYTKSTKRCLGRT